MKKNLKIITFADKDTAALYFFSKTASRLIEEDNLYEKERLLASPICIDRETAEEGGRATTRLVDLIHSMPSRFFGGDIQAFGRACNLTDSEISLLQTLPNERPCAFARGDAYLTLEGWKFTEFNIGSSILGFHLDNALRTIEENSDLRISLQNVGATRRKTDQRWASMVLKEAASFHNSSEQAVIRIVTSKAHAIHRQWNQAMAEALRKLGAEVGVCRAYDLMQKRDGLYAGDIKVHYVYRLFGIIDIKKNPHEFDHILDSAKKGNIGLGMPLNSRLYGNKAVLALLWNDRIQKHLKESELEDIRKYIPYTQSLSKDNLDISLKKQYSLVVKPANGERGQGIIFGDDHSPEKWALKLSSIIKSDKAYVMQERIFPNTSNIVGWSKTVGITNGRFDLVFGFFSIESEYAGILVRATPTGQKILSYTDDSYAGLAFEIDG